MHRERLEVIVDAQLQRLRQFFLVAVADQPAAIVGLLMKPVSTSNDGMSGDLSTAKPA